MTHWYDELVLDAQAYVGDKKDLVINGGLSVSGLQHVGRLRGEITLAQLLTRSFRDEGRKAMQSLVLYTQDEWKSKEGHDGSRLNVAVHYTLVPLENLVQSEPGLRYIKAGSKRLKGV